MSMIRYWHGLKDKPDGFTYLDKVWGYVMEKRGGRWCRQHRLIMEEKLGRKLRKDEVVHHKNGDRADNRIANLEVMSDSEHRSMHGKGRKFSEETKKKIRAAAKRIGADPEERKRRSERAKKQHAEGNLGRATWGPDSDPGTEVWRRVGRMQADRLRVMIKATPSSEMSRRSYMRKIFQ